MSYAKYEWQVHTFWCFAVVAFRSETATSKQPDSSEQLPPLPRVHYKQLATDTRFYKPALILTKQKQLTETAGLRKTWLE